MASAADAAAAGAVGAGGAAAAAEAAAAPFEPLRSFCFEALVGLLAGGGGFDGADDDAAGWFLRMVGAAWVGFFAIVGGVAADVCA